MIYDTFRERKLNSMSNDALNILEKENHQQAQAIAKELGIQKSTYSEYKNTKSKGYKND